MKIFKKINSSFLIGSLAVMLSAFLWSLDGILLRPKFYTLPPAFLVFLEHLLGFLLLSPFFVLGLKKMKHLRAKDWGAIFWVCLWGGLIGTVMITKAFFAAFAGAVTFATVIILQKLQPVFALVMARIILKEKLTKSFYFWASVAILAGIVLAFGNHEINLFEIDLLKNAAFFAFLAAFAFGSSTVFGKKAVNHLDFKTMSSLRFGITAILGFIFVFFTTGFGDFYNLSTLQWQLLGVIVFTSGAVAIFIYYFGLKRITASAATVLELFWPFSAVFLDYFINGNVLSPREIVAALVLLLAFYMVVSKGKKKNLEFKARVVSGEGRGERMGIPTINLDNLDLELEHGVYLVEAKIEGRKYKGLLHFGPKLTFDKGVSLELFLEKKYLEDLPENVIIKIVKKIRPIQNLVEEEKLKNQIYNDIKVLKEYKGEVF